MSESSHDHETVDQRPQVQPTADGSGSEAPLEPISMPERIGGYRLLAELARGGMGVVYKAESKALERQVAIKVLLSGEFASRSARERFQIEARLAARLRHPSIVGIHDVGSDGGHNYLVMDLIEGESLRAIIEREHRLEPRRVARIGQRLAEALYYAHSNSVLHRDVKPANVLLAADDQPVITDFGLAKDVGGNTPLSPTVSGQAIGTPSFMPPEQARGDRDHLDRRADVYSLGATLYCLLTGQPPFLAETPLQTMRIVLNEQPVPPTKMVPRLERDLETIVLKCLEKEPWQRYDSMHELREDLRRYLEHEPIAARPLSLAGRLRRWLRRHQRTARGAAVASAIAVVVLIATVVGFVLQLQEEHETTRQALEEARVAHVEAARQADKAKEAADEAARQAQHAIEAKEEADRQAELAMRRSEVAQESLEFLVKNVRDSLPDIPGEEARKVSQRILTQAIERLRELEELQGEHERSPYLSINARYQVGNLLASMGRRDEARVAYDKAIADARALLAATGDVRAREALTHGLLNLGDLEFELGRMQASHEAFVEAIAEGERIVSERPKDGQAIHNLALTQTRLAGTLAGMGRVEEATRVALKGLQLQRNIAADNPENHKVKRNLVLALAQVGELRLDAGDLKGAAEVSREAVELDRLLMVANPSPRNARELCISLSALARVEFDAGRLSQAQPLYAESLALARRLVRDDSRSIGLLSNLCARLSDSAPTAIALGRLDEAEALLREAVERSATLVDMDGSSQPALRVQESAQGNLGKLLVTRGRYQEARKAFERALAICRIMVAQAPEDVDVRDQLAVSLRDVGRASMRVGDGPAALAAYEEAAKVSRELTTLDPESLRLRHGLCRSLNALGYHLDLSGRRDEALARFTEALGLWRSLVQEAPDRLAFRLGLGRVLNSLGETLRFANRPAVASEHLDEAIATFEPLADTNREGPGLGASQGLFFSLRMQAELLLEAGKHPEAADHLVRCLPHGRRVLKHYPDDADIHLHMCSAYVQLAWIDAQRADWKACLERANAARDLLRSPPRGADAQRTQTVGETMFLLGRTAALMLGQIQPTASQDHLLMANAYEKEGKDLQIYTHLRRAIEDPDVRQDLREGYLQRTAKAAALAARAHPERSKELRDAAIELLREDVGLRRRRLAALRERLAVASPPEQPRLKAEVVAHERQLENVKTRDPALRELRERPEFDAIFE